MKIEFTQRENGPERLVAEAALVFGDGDGILEGLKLVGFSLWRGAEGELRVTFPARSFGIGSDRRYYDLVRSVDGGPSAVKGLKAWVVAEFEAWQRDA